MRAPNGQANARWKARPADRQGQQQYGYSWQNPRGQRRRNGEDLRVTWGFFRAAERVGATEAAATKLIITRSDGEIDAPLLVPAQAQARQNKSEFLPVSSVAAHAPSAQLSVQPGHTQPTGPTGTITTEDFLRTDGPFRRAIESFLLDLRSEHTRRAYGKDLTRFVKFLLARKFDHGSEQVDRAVVIAYKDQLLAEGLEMTTVDRHLACLRSFFGWMMDEGLLEKNPAERVRFLRPKKLSSTPGFTDDEVQRVLSIPNLHRKAGAQHFAILALLFYCGLRRSELVNLRTTNLAVERGKPVIKFMGKGARERLIALPPQVWKAIRYHLMMMGKTHRKDQYLFSPVRNNRTGDLDKPLDTSAIYAIVKFYSKNAGVQAAVSPHSCRATAISNARDHHVSDRAIQEFAGWASPDMITRYDKRKTAIEDSASFAIQYDEKDETLNRVPDWVSSVVDEDVEKTDSE